MTRPPETQGESGGLTLEEISEKATAYADHLQSPEGQETGLQIIAANLRDYLAAPPSQPEETRGATKERD